MHQGTTPSYSVTCAHCNVKLKSKRALDDHVIRKHPDFVTSVSRKIHECSMCSYKTLHKSSFDKHMTTHTETTSSAGLRECIHCNATFKSRASLDDHTLRKHPDFIATITRKIYECINCIYKTTIKSHFNKHMSVHTENARGGIFFRCFHCETTFKSKLAVDYHVVEQHPNFIASIARKIYECTKCGYKTIFKYHFERHMSTHPKIASSYEPKACVHCNATFKRKLWLDDHVVRKHVDFMSSVTSKLHECTKCSYKTVRKKLLVRHFLTHSYTAKSYSESCVHCNAKYQQRISLDDHIIKKHPEFITSVTRNVYKCTKCTFKTAKKGHFDRHTLMHSGIPSSRKLFTCIHCDVTVKGKMVLTEHVLKKHPDFASSITEKINTCTICNFKTTMKHHFDRHMSVHSGIPSSSKTFMCMYCDAVLKRRNALTDHVVRKHPSFIESVTSKIYECEHCVFKTIKKHDFDKHLSTHFEISPSSSSVTCIHCNDTFKSDRWRDAHIMKRHPEFTSSLTRKVYECTICPYKTILKFKFDRHMLEHPETASSYKFSSCHHCGAKFKIKADLDEHLVENHPNFIVSLSRKVYECTYCVYKTTVKKSLDKHMSSHPEADPSDKPNTCIHCNATFKNKGSLNDHILKKHPDFVSSITKKINTCTTCNFKTTIKHQFDRHMSVHSGISPISKTFTCIHCDAIVKSRNALTDHVVRKHPNFITSVTNKIYECTQCVYKTVKKYDLDKHLSTHSKTASRSNFSTCIHCNATFNTDKWLDAHIVKTHPGFAGSLTRKIYECTLCPYKTVFKYKLDRHMLKHAETDKINACIHCNATFKNKADLDEHVVRRHPNFTSSLSRKIYECTQCVYKSLRKKSFVKHMSRHPEAVPGDSLNRCVHCNATLRSKRALDDHVVRKHPDSAAPVGRKILECTECRFKTVLKGSLAQHMLTHFKAYNL
nr:unnamed protein product [Callosobruchus chinensis]